MSDDLSSYLGRILDAAREGRDAARESSSAAQEAAQEASQAARAGAEANRSIQTVGGELRRDISQVNDRIRELEKAVEQLIRVLTQELQALRKQTKEVELAVQEQGQGIQKNVQATTESVQTGFGGMARQQAEGRILDTRTQLIGVQKSFEEARDAIGGEHDKARRRIRELERRFDQTFNLVNDSLGRDIRRVGSRIFPIQEGFEGTVERHTRRFEEDEAFEVARQVGSETREVRENAIKPFLESLENAVQEFSEERLGLVPAVAPFARPRDVESGDFVLRAFHYDDGSRKRLVTAAHFDGEGGRVAAHPDEHRQRLLTEIAAQGWRQNAPPPRSLTADERARLGNYLSRLAGSGLISAGERVLIEQHVDRGGVTIRAGLE